MILTIYNGGIYMYECTLDAIALISSVNIAKMMLLTLEWVMYVVNVLNRCWNKYTRIPLWITGFYTEMGPRKLIYTAHHENVVNKEWLESEVLVRCEICIEGALHTTSRVMSRNTFYMHSTAV